MVVSTSSPDGMNRRGQLRRPRNMFLNLGTEVHTVPAPLDGSIQDSQEVQECSKSLRSATVAANTAFQSSQVPWAEERESTRAATKAEATFPRCKHVPIQEQKVWAKPLVKGVKNKKHDLTQNSQLNWPSQGSFVGPSCAEKKQMKARCTRIQKSHIILCETILPHTPPQSMGIAVP